jgi:hypothetical protein
MDGCVASTLGQSIKGQLATESFSLFFLPASLALQFKRVRVSKLFIYVHAGAE